MRHDAPVDALGEALRQVEAWLPHQGPIGVFIHQNTLSALEGRPFEEAVEEAARVLGAAPYMPHAWYLAALEGGRIELCDVEAALDREQDDPSLSSQVAARALRRAALRTPRIMAPDAAIASLMGRRVGPAERELWRVCVRAAHHLVGEARMPEITPPAPASRRDELTIQLAGAFLDRGLAYWPMPAREHGFYAAARQLLLAGRGWPRGVARLLLSAHGEATAMIRAALAHLEVPSGAWGEYLRRDALALPGWAGTFAALGHRPPEPGLGPASLADFMAVRLALRIAFPEVPPAAAELQDERLWVARELFLVLRTLGCEAAALDRWAGATWQNLWRALDTFGDVQRRRCLHRAYEGAFTRRLLGSIKAHDAAKRPLARPIDFQAVFCIDDREESLRRHVEEVAPACETFGAAGFFGVDMLFKSAHDADPVPLCPPVVKPRHLVVERFAAAKHEREGAVARLLHEGSRRFLTGAVLTQAAGLLAAVPLTTRVLAPGLGLGRGQPATRLDVEYQGVTRPDGVRVGYTPVEMADRVEGILRGIGLVGDFAPVVAVVGHGSSSRNNPHASAYDCGACGGRRGAPSARIFAGMANLPATRAELGRRGLVIPDGTWFVGGCHDTASDEVRFFDLDLVPPALAPRLAEVMQAFDSARALDAAERCRRFARNGGSEPQAALRHVAGRCADLREPRPECGHATNASLIVGRRSLTRGLFLDRRAFLVSYDHERDRDATILAGLLRAVVPVCAGINLEYYFSFVDNERYGCGTKLPHNVVGLVGVMNGGASDLRTGLPWQMVEIHEPVRLTTVLEAPLAKAKAALDSLPDAQRLIANRWIQAFVYDPDTGTFFGNEGGEWCPRAVDAVALPSVARSLDYARGLGHLAPARITGGL